VGALQAPVRSGALPKNAFLMQLRLSKCISCQHLCQLVGRFQPAEPALNTVAPGRQDSQVSKVVRQVIRPPVYGSNGRTYKMLVMFFFLSFLFRHAFSEFPRPIALKLCHLVGICVYFIMQVQKLGRDSPKKIRGPKTGPLQILIANISGTAEDIQNRPALQTMAIPPAFNEKVR